VIWDQLMMQKVLILTVAGVVKAGHGLRDNVINVGSTDRRVVASGTSIVRQVVESLPSTLH